MACKRRSGHDFQHKGFRQMTKTNESGKIDCVSEVIPLYGKLASGGYVDNLWDQVVLLQHEICEIDLHIEWQKFLIESLELNVQKEIITLQESEELRLAFESKQSELVEVRNQLLEKIQWIRDTVAISNKY